MKPEEQKQKPIMVPMNDPRDFDGIPTEIDAMVFADREYDWVIEGRLYE